MAYNLTNLTAAPNMLDMTIALNQMAGGWIGAGILIALYLVIFIGVKGQYTAKPALLYAGFTSSVVGLMLWRSGIVSLQIMLVPVILTSLSLLYALLNKD